MNFEDGPHEFVGICLKQIRIRAKICAAACVVTLIMSLVPTISNAQVQAASPMPGSVSPPRERINALTNNPNGSDWLKKFDRQPKDMPMPMPMAMPMPMNGMHHSMSHKMMTEHRMMMKRMKKQMMKSSFLRAGPLFESS